MQLVYFQKMKQKLFFYDPFLPNLRRKIDQYLIDWKNDKGKMLLIVKGARQIGKTDAIEILHEIIIKI